MIAKILKSGNFSDVVGYVLRQFHDPEKYTPDTWQVIDSDGIMGESYKQIVSCFDLGHSLNKRKNNPAGHIAVSFYKKDLPLLTDDFMVQLAKEYMERMGIMDTQYIIVRHFETEHPHFHIVYNRVNLSGKSINESNNFDRSSKATKAIKEKYDLTFSPKKKLYEDAKAEMKVKIKAAMYNCKSWDEFKRRLTPAGIDVEIYKDRDTEKPQGVRFTYGNLTFKVFAINRAFSFGRLDKFFNQNAGIKVVSQPEKQRVKVKFAPKPDPDTTPKNRRSTTKCSDAKNESSKRNQEDIYKIMAENMYALVKKQDEKIDELLKVNKQNKEMLSSIETRMVSMSAQPTAQNEPPGKIEVEFPPNIATDESVRAAIKTGLADQTKEIIKALNFRELPNLIRDAFKEIMETAFKAGFDASILEALDKAMDKAMSRQVARLTDSANSLYYKVQSIIEGHWWKVTPKWVFGIILLLLTTVIGLTIGCTHLYNENDKLREEEWMYRKTRTYFNTEELQKELVNMECDFYRGTWQEQDSIKDNIRWREQHYGLDKTFLHFYPTEE